jgi:hypothetical protein
MTGFWQPKMLFVAAAREAQPRHAQLAGRAWERAACLAIPETDHSSVLRNMNSRTCCYCRHGLGGEGMCNGSTSSQRACCEKRMATDEI